MRCATTDDATSFGCLEPPTMLLIEPRSRFGRDVRCAYLGNVRWV